MASVQIELDSVPMIVVGNYFRAEAETRTDPGTPEEFEVCEVLVSDSKHDIVELLKDRIDEIESLALLSFHEQQDEEKMVERRIAA